MLILLTFAYTLYVHCFLWEAQRLSFNTRRLPTRARLAYPLEPAMGREHAEVPTASLTVFTR